MIEEVRDRVNLIEVVSVSTQLTKVGGRWRGLCPFHSEKTPSFYVSEEKQVFHCFGCGASGNVFHFLMKKDGFTFPEALTALARKAGVELDEGPGRASRDEAARQGDKLAGILRAAAAYFQTRLEKGVEGTQARRYLAERGLDADTVHGFGIGYAPDDWESLVRHLQGAGCDLEACMELGLVAPRPKGGYYGRFRNRIMFPILDIEARVIGFGARAMPQAGEPKYLNSPESRLFHKGRTLYLLSRAREEIRKRGRVVVVEGYFDAIQLHAHGIGNVVATLGTSLTADHASMLRRYTDRVVMLYDGDAAGRKAASRAMPILLAADLFPLIALMPAGEDPDSLVLKEGKDAFAKRLEAARPVLDVEIEEAVGRVGPAAHERERSQCAKELAPLVALIRDPIEKDLVLRKVAQGLDLDERVLRQAFAEQERATARAAVPEPAATGGSGRPPDASQSGKGYPPAELGILKLILTSPTAWSRVAAETEAIVGDFESAELRALTCRLLGSPEGGPSAQRSVASLVEGMEDEGLRSLVTRLTMEAGGSDAADEGLCLKEIEDCLRKLRRDGLRRRKKDLTRRIAEAQAAGDRERVRSLLEEKAALVQLSGDVSTPCESGGASQG